MLRRILLALAIAVAVSAAFVALSPSFRNALRNAWIEGQGVPASAVVVAVETSEYTVDRRPLTRVMLDVRTGPGTTVRAVADQPLEPHLLARVVPGATVSVIHRPADPSRVVITAAP